MPTALKRIMLSVPEETADKLDKISKAEKRSMASTCLLLIESALKLPRFKEILHAAPEPDDQQMAKDVGLDKLSPERLQELQQLLSMLEKLKS